MSQDSHDCPNKSKLEVMAEAFGEDYAKRGWSDWAPPIATASFLAGAKAALDLAEVQAMRQALAFYRASGNWIKGSFEACSPIIADTGTKAHYAIAAFDSLVQESEK